VLDPTDGLLTLAEIAITLAGFSGLIAAFRSQDRWEATDKARLLNILVLCFFVVLCAMLPTFTSTYFPEQEDSWRLSCLLYGMVQLAVVVRFLSAIFQGTWNPAAPWISFPFAVIGLGVGLLAMSSGLGIGPTATSSLLGLVLIWGLVAAASQFVLSLQSVWGEPR
jgi:hypothetical protein